MANRLTKKQITDITAAFKLFDKNGDGHLSSDEIYEVLKETTGLSQEEVKSMVYEVDFDGNGSIELEEFLSMMGKYVQEGPAESEMWASFQNFDKDRNGMIDVDELKCTMAELGAEISLEDAKGMIAMADGDGDGHIDFEEFKMLMAQLAQEEFQ